MNFKDIYKSANDDIHADRVILNDIIAKSEYKNRPRFKVRYVYAAATIAIAVSVSMLAKAPSGVKTDKQIVKNTEYSRMDLTDENEVGRISDSSEEKTASDKDAPSSVGGDTSAVAEKQPDIIKDAETITDTTRDEGIFEEKDTTAQEHAYKHVASNDILRINARQSAPRTAMSGGGTAVYTAADTETVWVDITYGEYCEYIGMDIIANAIIPENLHFGDFETVSIRKENGEITNDEAHFSAVDSDGGKYVQVITSKLFNDADNYLTDVGFEKSIFNGMNVVVIDEDDVYSAYFMKNDTSVGITAYSFSENELKNLLSSLTR